MQNKPEKAKCRRCRASVALPKPPQILYAENVIGNFKAVMENVCPNCNFKIFSEFRGEIKKRVETKP